MTGRRLFHTRPQTGNATETQKRQTGGGRARIPSIALLAQPLPAQRPPAPGRPPPLSIGMGRATLAVVPGARTGPLLLSRRPAPPSLQSPPDDPSPMVARRSTWTQGRGAAVRGRAGSVRGAPSPRRGTTRLSALDPSPGRRTTIMTRLRNGDTVIADEYTLRNKVLTGFDDVVRAVPPLRVAVTIARVTCCPAHPPAPADREARQDPAAGPVQARGR